MVERCMTLYLTATLVGMRVSYGNLASVTNIVTRVCVGISIVFSNNLKKTLLYHQPK